MLAFCATPVMTQGHLLFAAMCTGYIFFAVKVLEERDLLREFGDRYRTYMEQVGGFVPKKLMGGATQPATFDNQA